MDTPPVVQIPSGSVERRLPLGVPVMALALMSLVLMEPVFVFKTLWGAVPCVPLWGFFRYHAKHDPLFLEIWAGQLLYKIYYHP